MRTERVGGYASGRSAGMLLAGLVLLLGGDPGMATASRCREIRTTERVGLENGQVQIWSATGGDLPAPVEPVPADLPMEEARSFFLPAADVQDARLQLLALLLPAGGINLHGLPPSGVAGVPRTRCVRTGAQRDGLPPPWLGRQEGVLFFSGCTENAPSVLGQWNGSLALAQPLLRPVVLHPVEEEWQSGDTIRGATDGQMSLTDVTVTFPGWESVLERGTRQ